MLGSATHRRARTHTRAHTHTRIVCFLGLACRSPLVWLPVRCVLCNATSLSAPTRCLRTRWRRSRSAPHRRWLDWCGARLLGRMFRGCRDAPMCVFRQWFPFYPSNSKLVRPDKPVQSCILAQMSCQEAPRLGPETSCAIPLACYLRSFEARRGPGSGLLSGGTRFDFQGTKGPRTRKSLDVGIFLGSAPGRLQAWATLCFL
jgi:hypothetical protein